MNDFLKTLQRGLTGMSPQQIEDILEDYREHFCLGLEAGKSEAQIAASLGDPKQLAKMHVVMTASGRAHQSRGFGDMARLVGAAISYKAGGGLAVGALYLACILVLVILLGTAVSLLLGGLGGLVLMAMQLSAGYIVYAVLSFFTALTLGAGGLLLFRFSGRLWRLIFSNLPLLARRVMRLDAGEVLV